MKPSIRLSTLAAILISFAPTLPAQVPQLVNYQGRVAVGSANFNGTGQFKFALVNAAGNTTYWSNDGTSVNGSQPSNAVPLAVSKGLYSVLLGDTTVAGMPTAIPASVWANPDVRLRVWFNDGTNGSQLLTPDQRLAPNGYLSDGAVSGSALATGAVTSAKIANGAVGSAQLTAAVPLLSNNQSFSGQNTFNNPANSFTGSSFSLGNGAGLVGDQGGSLELGNSLQAGASPFIDFHYGTGTAEDFNVRLINDGAGRLSLSGSLNVSGSITALTNLSVTGGIIQRGGAPLTGTSDLGLYSQGAGQFVRFVTNAAEFRWYTDGGVGSLSRMTLTPAGNLGIGTTTPRKALEVNGDIQMSGPRTKLFYKGDLDDGSQTGAMGFHTSNGGATALLIPYDAAGNSIANSTISIGGFGAFDVGTVALRVSGLLSAPSASIPTLNGDVAIGGTLLANGLSLNNGVIQRGGTPVTSTTDLGLYSQTSGSFVRFVTNTAPFHWYTDSGAGTTARMTLTSGGNLGLGVANPAQRLEVAGTVVSTGATINGPVSVGGSLSGGSATFTSVVTASSFSSSGPFSASSATIPTLNGNVAVGGALSAPSATIPSLSGNVTVAGEMTANVVTVLGGSDVAEPYEVAPAGDIEPIPGMVVAIDSRHVGQMRVAERAYDKTVAGILSGANGIAPGITLRQVGTVADGSRPVASIGRVWCYVDADANGPIEAGDMLTTSDTPGHAMRVDDHTLANGAVIGKAMSALPAGKGLVLVLVSLK